MKEDRYEFDLDEWDYRSGERGEADIILTRKKPKVKVEWQFCHGLRSWAGLREYGMFYIVQFRVTGWNGKYKIERVKIEDMVYKNVLLKDSNYPSSYVEEHGLSVNQDARNKWSAPVLLPESVYKELDNICKALEEKANEVKG